MISEVACSPPKAKTLRLKLKAFNPTLSSKPAAKHPARLLTKADATCEDISGRGSICGRFWGLQPQTLAWCSALGLSSRHHSFQFHSLALETRAGSPSYQIISVVTALGVFSKSVCFGGRHRGHLLVQPGLQFLGRNIGFGASLFASIRALWIGMAVFAHIILFSIPFAIC